MSIIINPATTISSDDDETVNKNRFITRLAIVASMSGLLFGYDTVRFKIGNQKSPHAKCIIVVMN